PDLAALRGRVEAAGAELVAPRVYERNLRYDDTAGSLTPNDIVLRLRQDTRARLTYKAPGPDPVEGRLTRLEYETEVGDLDTMDAILRKLGFAPYMVYEKYRTTYHLHGVEVVLDEMPYGDFIEIEGEPDSIERAVAAVGLGDAHRITQSYADLFDLIRAEMNLRFTDLTFENFEGLSVPATLFERA
ncbi:MAG: class IV adenylate cyclase, partial [Anaerolineales bacterium]